MIAIVLMFGPAHGRTHYLEGPLTNEIVVTLPEGPRQGFYPYEFGSPYSGEALTGNMRRHRYRLHDAFENGVEEGAVYFHEEDCCTEDYSKSSDYERNGPPKRESRRPRWEPEPTKRGPRRLFDGFQPLGSLNRERGKKGDSPN